MDLPMSSQSGSLNVKQNKPIVIQNDGYKFPLTVILV